MERQSWVHLRVVSEKLLVWDVPKKCEICLVLVWTTQWYLVHKVQKRLKKHREGRREQQIAKVVL